jgi:hypothetical protein
MVRDFPFGPPEEPGCGTPRQCGKLVRDAAKRWRQDGLRESDLDLRKSYFEDARDLRAVAKLVSKGEREAARSLAWNLDTIVRDMIPRSVWDWISPPRRGFR